MDRAEIRATLRASIPLNFGGPQAYVIASTAIVSGFWWPEILLLAAVCYSFSWWVQNRRPRLLVLRCFGVPDVETFLRVAVGGLGTFARPIWLYDARASYKFRKNLPDLWLYVTRSVVWVVFGWSILGRVNGKLPFEVLWVCWMIIASSVYHRYKAGQSPTSWIACAGAGVCAIVVSNLVFGSFPSVHQRPWIEVAAIGGLFLLAWAFLAGVLVTTPFDRLFSWMYRRPLLETEADLTRYSHELQGAVLFPRYLPTASLQVAEIGCTSETWGAAVYDSIGFSALVLANVSSIEETAALTWELKQARLAGAPVLLTCDEAYVGQAQEVLSKLGQEGVDLFVWRRDPKTDLGVSFDSNELREKFFLLVERHLSEDLAYLPIRPTRDEAIASLNTMHRTNPPPNPANPVDA